MLVIAHQIELPSAGILTMQSGRRSVSGRPLATRAAPAAAEWARAWLGFIADYPLPCNELSDAFTALQRFWTPILGRVGWSAAVGDRAPAMDRTNTQREGQPRPARSCNF